jgi:serine/threonine-protein kinase RsbW
MLGYRQGDLVMKTVVRAGVRVFPGRPAEVSRVRDFVACALAGFAAVANAVLIASELATNALVHTASGRGGRFAVIVRRDGGSARVEVWDGGGASAPVIRPDGRDGESGAGLGLVEVLAQRWGHSGGPGGRVVWFEVQSATATGQFSENRSSGETAMPGYAVAVNSPALESLSDADLLGEASALFGALAGTRDDPRAGQLHALLAEASRRAAKLRTEAVRLCACGEAFADADALDDHLSAIFTPADDIAADGHVHAEVALGTPVPWAP